MRWKKIFTLLKKKDDNAQKRKKNPGKTSTYQKEQLEYILDRINKNQEFGWR